MKSTKNDKIKEINITPSHGRSRGKTTAQYVQHLCYLPFGESFVDQRVTNYEGSRYTFSGKERDSETGYSYFGARYYSSDYSIWLSVDPLSDKYPSMSPYMYCAGNPVRLVDVDGREINPIYDLDGNFLGTDDNGIRGEAFFMERAEFKQNMSPDVAQKLNKGQSALRDEAANEKYCNHYAGIKNRTDYDGYISLDEANDWYRNGHGAPLFADLTKIDLSAFRSMGDSKVGKKYTYNLLYWGKLEDGLVYGSITFVRTPNDGVRAYADRYNFDMKSWKNPFNWGRNIETKIGESKAGSGQSYLIYFYGTVTLERSLFAD